MIKNKNILKKYLIILVSALLIVAVIILIHFNQNASDQASSSNPKETINLDPPTQEDAKRVEANKEKNVARDEAIKNQPSLQPGTKKTVNPTITYAGLYGNVVEVGGYVGGIFEDGGTCTSTFIQDSTILSKSVQAVKNINSVDCPVMSAQKNEFIKNGKWSITLSYDSSTANGKSDAREIEIK